jgi:DNA-binding response OmpR family regulator
MDDIQGVSILSARILLIGDAKRESSLQRNWEVITAPSGKQAMAYVHEHLFDLIVVDAESMRTSGLRICRSLKNGFPTAQMIHIQPKTASDIAKVADVTLCPPLSSRKLVGVINRLLTVKQRQVIQCGPFEMSPATRILRAHGQEVQLNPKLANLIELFFTHPNEVLDRETIMKQVWDTNYMGDTRTLDVHIRHVRNVLENGNKTPQYLKTVRGVGYRLDIQITKNS